MKALILNSGMGSRMGSLTQSIPKCMVSLTGEQTIIERQLEILRKAGIDEVVVTTGYRSAELERYVDKLGDRGKITFVRNSLYEETNYIYSIYLARKYLWDDIILLHGDLVFEQDILEKMLNVGKDCMAVSTVYKIPEKDFKAVIKDGKIIRVGVEYFEDVAAAQPLYVLKKALWMEWLSKICEFCENGICDCYAEKALNQILDDYILWPFDFGSRLCQEVDSEEDLVSVRKSLED